MTPEEQTAAIGQFGYTPREAAFLALAALHAGYFLRRQFSSKGGKLADRLCRKVVAQQHATAAVYASNTHLYHLHAKPLYAALGQEDNRHRRRREPLQIRAKLMGLDYVLAHPSYRFLPTEEDKLSYFCEERGIARRLLPAKTYKGKDGTETDRFFVDKYPIRIDPDTGKIAFCYIDDGVFTPPGFPLWLHQYAALIGEIGVAEIIYIAASPAGFPGGSRQFARHYPAAEGALSTSLLAYFELRKEIEECGPAGRPQEVLDLFRKLSRRYAEPRFQTQYAAWRGAAIVSGNGPDVTFSTFLLSHSYRLFGTVAGSKSGEES